MLIESKYYRNRTTHRSLLQNPDDPANNSLSCGFLHKQGAACTQRDILFNHYGGLYVITGTGAYIDAVTGGSYPITPGCVVQRMPGQKHHTFIDPDSNWLEFYFCVGAKLFDALTAMKLATDEPVFFAGENMEIVVKLLAYQELMEHTDDSRAAELIPEFQKLLLYLNACRNTPKETDRMRLVCDRLRQNCAVGTPLREAVGDCGIGYEALRKQFRRIFGCSLSQYRIQLRMNISKTLLLDRQMSIKEVAAELGYCDVYAFCNQFRQQVGVFPGRFVSDWGK